MWQRSSPALRVMETARHHMDMLGGVQGRRAGPILRTAAVAIWWTVFGGLTLLGPVAALDAQRRWLPTPVEVAAWEDVDGTLLGTRPLQIQRSPRGGLVVTDWGDFSIREVSAAGELVWKFGRNGPGPGEFLAFVDLKFDEDGSLHVLDPRNRRITVVSSVGELLATVPVRGGTPASLLPPSFDPGHFAVVPYTNKRDTLWTSFSKAGIRHRAVLMPAQVAFDHDLTGEGWAVGIPGGRAAVYFRWSSRMIILEADGSVGALADGVEAIPFPEVVAVERSGPGWTITGFKVDPKAVKAARGATATTSRIYVLYLGSTSHAGRVVDTYSTQGGEYLGSHLFPRDVDAITVLADGRLATLENRLFPTLRLWELPVGD